MNDVAICTYWNGTVVPLPHTNAQGYHLCGDWSIPLAVDHDFPEYTKGNMERWFDGYLRRRLPKLGLTADTTATLMMDFETDSAAFRAYPSLVHAACKMMPKATIGMWVSGPWDKSLTPAMLSALRAGRAAIMQAMYQQRIETLAEAGKNVADWLLLSQPLKVPVIVCLSPEIGWEHPLYPKGPGNDSLGPLCEPDNPVARRAMVSKLARAYGITQTVWWASCRDPDIARAKALTGMSVKMRERVERMRGDEAGVAVATIVAT